ncbi:unnamed protein product [Caenorhabditis angaria]|uniref:Uncharacterized protein n=1 Tax=Caenorhabditis angaria TaxID=860376 RepID=A0A9P1IZ01_9PELO|nr:unnamed protein product [Caenorhabditis angaria]
MEPSRRNFILFRDWALFIFSHLLTIAIYAVALKWLNSLLPGLFTPSWWIIRLVIAHFSYLIYSHFQRSLTLPPGPPPMIIFGNSPCVSVVTPEVTFLEYRELYGPVFTLHLGKPTVVLASHETIHQGLITEGPHTAGRSSNESFTLFTNDRENGDGIILAMRQKWRDMRSEITRFMGGLYGDRIDEIIRYHTRLLETEMLKISEHKGLIDLRDPLAGAIANVIQQITIGKTFMFQDQEFQDQLRDINAVVKEIMTGEVFLVNRFPVLKMLPEGLLRKWTNYKKSGFRLQQWFRTILEDHLINRHQGDYMSYMVERKESGKAMFKDLSIILTCGDIWTGGMETTVTTLRWGIIYLLKNMEVQEKCHREIVEVFGEEEPEMRRMLETPYVRATISEIQRLANVLPWAIPHKTLATCTIGGYTIPENTDLIPGIGAVLNDPEIFEDPKKFDPERFLDKSGNYVTLEKFRPFGLGPRSCLGERIARTELYMIFCTLVQNFKFYLNENDPVPSTDRVIGGITAPPQPFAVRLEYRNIRPVK